MEHCAEMRRRRKTSSWRHLARFTRSCSLVCSSTFNSVSSKRSGLAYEKLADAFLQFTKWIANRQHDGKTNGMIPTLHQNRETYLVRRPIHSIHPLLVIIYFFPETAESCASGCR